MLLLAEAVERLAVRPNLFARENDRGARAAANVEAFLERARTYGVEGLKRFVRDMMKESLAVGKNSKLSLAQRF